MKNYVVALIFLAVAVMWGFGLENYVFDDSSRIEANRRRLYDRVSERMDMGISYGEFYARMNKPDKRKEFYNLVSDRFNIGSFEEFEKGVTRKDISIKWVIIYSIMFLIIFWGIKYLKGVNRIVIHKEDKEPDIIHL